MITGTIKKIFYSNNDFIVALVGEEKVSGNLPNAVEGIEVTLWGDYKEHPKYGRQFFFTRYKIFRDDPYPYLTSGLVKGLGESLANKIMETFPDPIMVSLKKPGNLSMVNGISKKKALEISRSVRETIKYSQIATDLQPCKLPPQSLIKAYHQIGDSEKILENPYTLTEIEGIGFIKADKVAQELGISAESPRRIQAALKHELSQAAAKEGHVFIPEDELAVRTFKRLDEKIPPKQIEQNIKLIECSREGSDLYTPNLLKSENEVADFFKNYIPPNSIDVSGMIDSYEKNLSPSQKKAVEAVYREGMIVITGGPGTGKTETVRAITTIHKQLFPDEEITLAAPTGRASQRMTETTGIEAKTIHRIIKHKTKIAYRLIIIDEASMVDLELLAKFLKQIAPGTRLVLVGDPDQLPSVGAGQILSDVSDTLPTVRLTQIFRQAEASDIIINAHRINHGDLNLKINERDFFFIEREKPEDIFEVILDYTQKHIQKRGSLQGLQVLSPMKKGILGTDELNSALKDHSEKWFLEGDRVIQTTNNYSKGVFNGEIGTVVSSDPLQIKFDDQEVDYKTYEAEQLSLAYAVTIHKAQGSEFPVVVIPLHTQHFIMLNRKILYTAITRARKIVLLVGNYKALGLAVGNYKIAERNSNLKRKISSQ